MASKFSGTLIPEAGIINDGHFSNATGDRLTSSKQMHVIKCSTNFDLPIGSAPVAREEIVYVAPAAATVKLFRAMCYDTGTASSVTFDLKINGTTILTGTISITNADLDRTVKDGALASTSLAADDVLSIALAVSSSTGMQGPYAEVYIEESGTPA